MGRGESRRVALCRRSCGAVEGKQEEGRDKEYEHIHGILLDVKYLMQIAEKHSETDIRKLVELIEKYCSECMTK